MNQREQANDHACVSCTAPPEMELVQVYTYGLYDTGALVYM